LGWISRGLTGKVEHVFGPQNDPVEQVLELLDELGVEDRAGWTPSAQSERVEGLAPIVERAQAELVRATGAWDGAVAWAEDGAGSPVSWLAHRTQMARAKADRLVRCARLARHHERTAKALAAGDVTSGHLEVLADKTRRRVDLFREHEDVLLDAAAALDVDDFARAAEAWRLLADDLRANTVAAEAVEHGELHVSSAFGRCLLTAELDTEGAKTVLEALDARCAPEPVGELAPRTRAERRAAALVEMAAASLDRGSIGGRAPIVADVIVDVETLLGEPPADLRQVRCELSNGVPVTIETAVRLCCDASVGRVLMRGASELLDLGRRTRVVSPAQRRALVHRDRGCVFPGCDRKPQWTDAHHLRHWTRGGATDLDNLCLLCRRHHVMVHEGGWTLARDPVNGTWTADRSSP
jgi:hypothetical protein